MRKYFNPDRLITGAAITLITAFVAMVVLVVTILVTGWVTDAQNRSTYAAQAAAYERPASVNADVDAVLARYARSLGGSEIVLRWDAETACSETNGEHPYGCVRRIDPATIHLHPRALDEGYEFAVEVVAHEVAHSLVWTRGITIPEDSFRLNYALHPPAEHFAHCAAMSVTTQDEERCAPWQQEIALDLLGWGYSEQDSEQKAE
ncbi:MAG: hypothetical protein R2732_10310 [Microbacteriaceae bacterium]